MLHQLIKEATKNLHDELEKLMFVNEIMDGSLTYEQYKQIMITNYLITAEYESKLLKNLDAAVSTRLNMHKRIKLDALLEDLAEINTNVKDLAGVADLDLTKDFALGCLYVLEGATLGGNVIVKKLKANELLKVHQLHFHYYQVYGEQLISYWKQFCEVINEQDEACYPNIIAGAEFMY